jgi:hypothetical protein
LAFVLTSSYEPTPMQPRRTPFRATLDRLVQEFAHAVVQAACKATLADILGMPERAEHTIARAPARREPLATPPAKAARRRKPRETHAPGAKAAPTPVVAEPEMAEGTEIDAQALLASIDRVPPPRAHEGAASPAIFEPPAAAPPPPPPSERRTAPVPALREGEQAVRTGAGHVVLRRRRAVGAA